MPGLKLVTTIDAATCLKLAWRAAQDLGFSLTPINEGAKQFTATKGNAVLGLLAGAIAPRCVFQIAVETYPDGNEVSLEKNQPWLGGGSVGVSKVNRQAEELMNALARAIEGAGGTISDRKEY